MQFLNALLHRRRLLHVRLPDTWSRIEVRCPACKRVYVALVSPREDPAEARQAARVRLIRTCPGHAPAFYV